MRRTIPFLALALITACAPGEEAETAGTAAMAAGTADEALPTVLVYKTATCMCCNGWIDHMREAGFAVEARDERNIVSIKMEAGVPTQMSSCHTALIDGYVVEGHVPAGQIKQLLADRPDIVGIAAPGMPIGSPGMEGANPQPYEIYSFDGEGNREVYAEIDPALSA